MPTSQASILIYGRDRQLLETRRMVLERTGARIWTAADISEFNKIPAGEPIDLVILCHSLSAEDSKRALALAHVRWTEAKSLSLVLGDHRTHTALSEQVADVMRGPAYLLNTVANLVEARQTGPIHTA